MLGGDDTGGGATRILSITTDYLAPDATRLRHIWRGPHFTAYDPEGREGDSRGETSHGEMSELEVEAGGLYFQRDLLHGPPYNDVDWFPYDAQHWENPRDEWFYEGREEIWASPVFFPGFISDRLIGRPSADSVVLAGVVGRDEPLVADHLPSGVMSAFGPLLIPEFGG